MEAVGGLASPDSEERNWQRRNPQSTSSSRAVVASLGRSPDQRNRRPRSPKHVRTTWAAIFFATLMPNRVAPRTAWDEIARRVVVLPVPICYPVREPSPRLNCSLYSALGVVGGFGPEPFDGRGALIGGVIPFMRRYSTIWP